MNKRFNITGSCNPQKHYMVCIDERLREIKEHFVDEGSYFVINRGRQYGKTTTLQALEDYLKTDYLVISMDFQEFSETAFKDEQTFCLAFTDSFLDILKDNQEITADEISIFDDYSPAKDPTPLMNLFKHINLLCKLNAKPIVLIVDEVDSASNNQVFLDFLAIMRNYYLKRAKKPTFHSVVLAGVYDIKNLKQKIRPDEDHKYNSPWNIADDFKLDMSFSAEQIEGMLTEYEADNHTGMDISAVSREIRHYTNGYPYLVSWLCKWMDEDGGKVFTTENVTLAVRELLKTTNTLFDDMIKKLDDFPDFADFVKEILFNGKEYLFQLTDRIISLGAMFGILSSKDGKVTISNIIFETCLYNHFSSERTRQRNTFSQEKSQFLTDDGHLNMEQILRKFQEVMWTEYRTDDENFYEKQGGLLFLCFLKPIINGVGNYYVEPETRNNTRMDIVVFYERKEYIIELKIWHGDQYREKGLEQLAGYMESHNTDEGYLVSFNFNQNKTADIRTVDAYGKKIVEASI